MQDISSINLRLNTPAKNKFYSLAAIKGVKATDVLRAFIEAFNSDPEKYIKELN